MTLRTFRAMAGLGAGGQPARQTVCAALDIGTHKVACLIARVRPAPERDCGYEIRIVGSGYHESRGVKGGVIVDVAAAERSIRGAIDQAERMSGMTIDEVIVNASCGRLKSEIYEIGVPVETGQVRQQDLDRVLRAARAQPREDGRLTLHSVPLGYALDDHEGVHDPLGMYGARLSVGMHVVTAEPGPLRNLALGVDRAHVRISRVAASPLVSALATLSADEADLGALCLDMGAGSTTLAMFADGMFVHADGIAIGGQHVTLDLARGLSVSLAEAERLKVLHGGVLANAHDDDELIEITPLEAGEAVGLQEIAKSAVTRIVRPRVEEIFEMIRDRLAQSGVGPLTGQRIVLTGGASQLAGVDELASRIFGAEVRKGAPRPFVAAPAGIDGPHLAAVAGLVTYAQCEDLEPASSMPDSRRRVAGGYMSRVGRWLREGF